MLILDQTQVARLLTIHDCIDVMATALTALAQGDAILPLRTVIRLPEANALAVMPAYVGVPKMIGAKVITVFPQNHGGELDSHQGAVLLFDPESGSLAAVVDATEITRIRTAAVSALATRLLAREDAEDLAILGAGVQAHAHLEAMLAVRPVARLRVWSRNAEHATSLARAAIERFSIEATTCRTAEEAVRPSAIVCTTTSATRPILLGDWLAPGAHVNAVGACTPNAREIDTRAVVRSRLYVDRRESALKEPGDIVVPLQEGAIGPEHIVGELGDVLTGRAPGRQSDDEITLFESLGLAVEDLAAAAFVHDRALHEHAGMSLHFGGRRDAQP
jgi:ornithine cyclodeaminase/alanine dehydrogenase-like protein (mu-crystallin family)